MSTRIEYFQNGGSSPKTRPLYNTEYNYHNAGDGGQNAIVFEDPDNTADVYGGQLDDIKVTAKAKDIKLPNGRTIPKEVVRQGYQPTQEAIDFANDHASNMERIAKDYYHPFLLGAAAAPFATGLAVKNAPSFYNLGKDYIKDATGISAWENGQALLSNIAGRQVTNPWAIGSTAIGLKTTENYAADTAADIIDRWSQNFIDGGINNMAGGIGAKLNPGNFVGFPSKDGRVASLLKKLF